MARGKKTSYEDMQRMFISYAQTGNFAETAKKLGFSANTVKGVILKNKDKNEFANLLNKNKKAFADKATTIIDKGLNLIERRLDRAIEHEEALDEIIYEIERDSELSEKTKISAIRKIRELQLQSAKDLAVLVGTMYDKRALSQDESTENTKVVIGLEE